MKSHPNHRLALKGNGLFANELGKISIDGVLISELTKMVRFGAVNQMLRTRLAAPFGR